MITLVLWLSVLCSACLSLPVPLTKVSTSAPPYNGFTVFPLCDKDCNGFPGYKVTTYRIPDEEDREGKELSTTTTISTTTTTTVSTTTTTVPTTTTTTTTSTTTSTTTTTTSTSTTTTEVSSTPNQPESSTVFANCDGNCPRMPAFKVASETIGNGADGDSRTGRMEEPSKPELEELSRQEFEERPEPEVLPKPELLPLPEPEVSETSQSSTASPESSSTVAPTTTTVKTASVEAVDAESTDNVVINETSPEQVLPTTGEIKAEAVVDSIGTEILTAGTEESSDVGEGSIR